MSTSSDNKRPIIIGLTGGIGSGKSTIAKLLEVQGFPVYYADDRAKALYFESEVKEKVIALFGPEVYSGDRLNRSYLGDIVFKDREKLKSLNAIIHPAVVQDFEKWLRLQDSAIVFKEAAILFESGSYRDCDAVVMVAASEQIRIERVMSRDGVTKEEVQARMDNQWTQERKAALSDFVFENETNEEPIGEMNRLNEFLQKLRRP